jgi:probable HAF family extracellular repeat protein
VAGWHCLDLRPFCDDFQRAVVWQPDGSVTDLGFGIVNAISDRSLAVGRSSGLSGYPLAWRDGTAIQIAPAGEAFDVNEAGYVVGTINVLGEPHAFVWHEARGLQDLGPGEARSIDEAGDIVGWRTTDGVRRATLTELRVEDLFIGLEAIAGRLLAAIDASQAEEALRDISRARDGWTDGDSKRARRRLRQALDAMVKLNRSGELSDVRTTAVLSLGNTLANRL